MTQIGPELSALLIRLRQASPEIFLKNVDATAVICDFLRDHEQIDQIKKFSDFHNFKKYKNLQDMCLLALWLYLSEDFKDQEFSGLLEFFELGLAELSNLVLAEEVLEDSDRGEEFVRRCLQAIDLRPLGESISQAEDRLRTLDSVEAEKLEEIAVTRRLRAQQVLTEMKRAAATAAAAKVSRE